MHCYLDVLALRQSSKALVQYFACSISPVLSQQPGHMAQPDLGAGAELAAHGFQGLLCQLILDTKLMVNLMIHHVCCDMLSLHPNTNESGMLHHRGMDLNQ